MDLQKYIERTFSEWTWINLLVASVLSIAVIMLASAQISSESRAAHERLVANYAGVDSSGRVISRWLDRDDPRAFLDIGGGAELDETFGVSWVSGSSISIRDAPEEWQVRGRSGYNLTEVAARFLDTVDEQQVSMHRYLVQGARSGDIRRAVLHALEDPNSDLILIPVNSIFVFNNYLAFTKSKQRAQLLSNSDLGPVDYFVSATLLSPLEVVLNGLVSADGSYANRLKISQSFGADTIKPFLAGSTTSQSGGALNLWQKWFFEPGFDQPMVPEIEWLKGYRANILMQDVSEASLGRRLFQANLKSASQSGKMVVFYVAPLPPEVQKDPVLLGFLEEMYSAMEADFERYGSDKVKLLIGSNFNTPQPHKHRDMIHLNHGHGLVASLFSYVESEYDLEITYNSLDHVYTREQK